MTRTKPEKRQRIIISAKYDEALERVDHRLQQVLTAVNALQRDGVQNSKSPGQSSLQDSSDFPRGSSSHNFIPDPNPATMEEYRGNSSFEAQVDRVMQSLNSLAGRLGPQESFFLTPTSQITEQITIPQDKPRIVSYPSSSVGSPAPFFEKYPELRGTILPPSEPVLKLLRLCLNDKQRFFVDFGFFDEQEFTEICRDVFFATTPYTMAKWSIVNAGLYYLFIELEDHYYAEMGLDSDQIDQFSKILAKNTQESVESFRMCSEPSLIASQALALLVSRVSGTALILGTIWLTALRGLSA